MEQKLKKYDRKNAGITLIALIITIIVMLILVGVTISLAVNGGLFNQAGKAVGDTNKALRDEHELANGDIIDYYLNQYNSESKELNHSGIIPEGATYTAVDGTVYEAGDAFPELTEGDIYVYGDYNYCYGFGYCECGTWTSECECLEPVDGWGVRCVNNVEKPGAILNSINSEKIVSLSYAFYAIDNMVEAPRIPQSVTNLFGVFIDCSDLITAPTIPSGVMNMEYAFAYCGSLTGVITINANPFYDQYCFHETVKPIVISTTNGACTVLEKLAETANNGNVMVVSDPDLNHSVIIPEGATYTAMDGTVYEAGDAFPETIEMGDIYNYGDYEYCYGFSYCDCNSWSNECGCENTTEGWGVYCVSSEEEPGSILESIAGESITSMTFTFYRNEVLTNAPNIPSTVTELFSTFDGCKSLTTAPVIPNGVMRMEYIFSGCTSLTDISRLVIPNSVTNLNSSFSYCTSLTDISGLVIPNSVIDLSHSFSGCTSLTDISGLVIPNSVKYMASTFYGCTGLSGTITINASPDTYISCFQNVDMSKITIAGSMTLTNKRTLANTGLNGGKVTIID